ncbi:MAG TPA: LysM peptidoglycan-binding domain-containing protein [Nitrospiraceae bacterium]|nr:LysM peptidoglycan-binding domain-containing protein [Nitrospiraceae bacterium]
MRGWLRFLIGIAAWAGCALGTGCARLETTVPREVEMQVTVDSLRTAVQDAQRAATELRVELEERRKELADAQVARAQLQGMLRETERRLADARQIIDLQREELSSARVERERLAQASEELNGRLQHLQRAKLRYNRKPMALSEVTAASVTTKDTAEVLPLSTERELVRPSWISPPAPDMPLEGQPEIREFRPTEMEAQPLRTIVVSEGDTLWRLARRHKVDLEELRTLNGLPNDTIVSGRMLRLPASRAARPLTDFAPSVSAVR